MGNHMDWILLLVPEALYGFGPFFMPKRRYRMGSDGRSCWHNVKTGEKLYVLKEIIGGTNNGL